MKKEVKRTSFGKVALARARSQSNTDGRGLGRACATAWIFHFGLLGAARHDLHLSPCRPPACARPHTLSLTHTHTIHSDAHTLKSYALRVRAAVWVASKKRMKPGFRRDEQFGTRSASRRECILPQGARADRRGGLVAARPDLLRRVTCSVWRGAPGLGQTPRRSI